MPTRRLYRPVRARVTTLDHIRAHGWQFTLIAGLWTTFGALLCWTWIDPGGGPTTVLSQLDPLVAGAVAVVLLVTGLLVLASILWRGDDRTALRMEMPALLLGASAWIAYAAVATSTIWRALTFWVVLGCILRVIEVWLVLRRASEPHRPAEPQVVVVEE